MYLKLFIFKAVDSDAIRWFNRYLIIINYMYYAYWTWAQQKYKVLFQGNKIPEMGKSLQKARIIHIRS